MREAYRLYYERIPWSIVRPSTESLDPLCGAKFNCIIYHTLYSAKQYCVYLAAVSTHEATQVSKNKNKMTQVWCFVTALRCLAKRMFLIAKGHLEALSGSKLYNPYNSNCCNCTLAFREEVYCLCELGYLVRWIIMAKWIWFVAYSDWKKIHSRSVLLLHVYLVLKQNNGIASTGLFVRLLAVRLPGCWALSRDGSQ